MPTIMLAKADTVQYQHVIIIGRPTTLLSPKDTYGTSSWFKKLFPSAPPFIGRSTISIHFIADNPALSISPDLAELTYNN